MTTEIWLALAIGNSRLHWAQFAGSTLQRTWETPHRSAQDDRSIIALPFIEQTPLPPLMIASVVAAQSVLWQAYPAAHFITLEEVPLRQSYATLGIDRALAVWGAISTLGSPVLVIDAGTALTFTGADRSHQLIGGAILPGLGLQFHMLNHATAALPLVQSSASVALPPRWAMNTTDAIASGILYTLLAGVQEFVTGWWQQFPQSLVVLTGGDRDRLYAYLTAYAPDLATQITVEPHLIFWGMCAVKNQKA